jgi:hypothetical protein
LTNKKWWFRPAKQVEEPLFLQGKKKEPLGSSFFMRSIKNGGSDWT